MFCVKLLYLLLLAEISNVFMLVLEHACKTQTYVSLLRLRAGLEFMKIQIKF